MNSDFIIARAERLATRLERASCGNAGKCPDCDARISQAFLVVIGREPTLEERTAARRFLEKQPSRYPRLAEPDRRHHALVDFCQMILASNAFLYVE